MLLSREAGFRFCLNAEAVGYIAAVIAADLDSLPPVGAALLLLVGAAACVLGIPRHPSWDLIEPSVQPVVRYVPSRRHGHRRGHRVSSGLTAVRPDAPAPASKREHPRA